MPSCARVRGSFSPSARGLTLLLALGWLIASPAAAGTLTIDFDFASGSSLSVLGGAITTPPDGAITSGSGQITVEATDASTPTVGGTAELAGANVAGNVSKNVLGQAQVDGPISFQQLAPATGTLTAPDTITLSGSLQALVIANLTCSGAQCSALGLPINVASVFLFPLQPLPIQNLDTPGAAFIDFMIPVSLDGVQGVFHLVGTEVGRTFIPEPGTAMLLGLGLLGLATRRR